MSDAGARYAMGLAQLDGRASGITKNHVQCASASGLWTVQNVVDTSTGAFLTIIITLD